MLWLTPFLVTLLSIAEGADAPIAPSPQKVDPDKVRKLIAQLGEESYEQREMAQKALFEMGKAVVPLLTERLTSADLEVKTRLTALIGRLTVPPLVGTRWRVTCKGVSLDPSIITLRADGTFHKKGDKTLDETWEIRKNGYLRLSLNGGYAIYDVPLSGKKELHGKAHNIKGRNWTFIMKRLSPQGGSAKDKAAPEGNKKEEKETEGSKK